MVPALGVVRVGEHGFVPLQPEEAQHAPDLALEIVDQILVPDGVKIGLQDFGVLPPQAHDLGVQPGGVLDRVEIRHGVVDLEVLHEAAQADVARVAQGQDDLGPGEQPFDQPQVNGVQRELVDEQLPAPASGA